MGQRLAQRQHVVHRMAQLLEQQVHRFEGAELGLLFQSTEQLGKLLQVMLAQFLGAQMQTAIDILMRRQDQGVGPADFQPVERVEPLLQWIAFGLD